MYPCQLFRFKGSRLVQLFICVFIYLFQIYFSACQCILLSICCVAVLFCGLVCHYKAPPWTVISALGNGKYLISGKDAQPFVHNGWLISTTDTIALAKLAIYIRCISVLWSWFWWPKESVSLAGLLFVMKSEDMVLCWVLLRGTLLLVREKRQVKQN